MDYVDITRDAIPTNIVDPLYYQGHAFFISDPLKGLKWLRDIGQENVAEITTLRVYVEPKYNWLKLDEPLTGHHWCEFFSLLAERATHLAVIAIYWDCDVESWEEGRLGGGSDPDMVWAVEQLEQLEELREVAFTGYYDESWAEYFGERFGREIVEMKAQLEAEEPLSAQGAEYLENLAVYRQLS
ncbi:hypothetical protein HYFRA_00003455 [Hymenoscyphus fraxineus]|uniref:Uncharacterized protein n=1 Tax=Hymenoscyphus fraxineus TaxID=746836 RepID=A0A9N9KWG7_9HELO|nr:hypothetical protein HYFRA_00003455 [Hymenoscyphus fraxineus]